MKLFLIGDAHGRMPRYIEVLAKLPEGSRSIQLGDMGHGFRNIPELPKDHLHLRGNHDDPAKALAHPNYLGEYGYLDEYGVFYFGGAFSIDWKHRVRGFSWWPDEEQSAQAMEMAAEVYAQSKPRVVVSHECPSKAGEMLLRGLMGDYFYEKAACQQSRTAKFLQTLLDVHQPEFWVFGHYHVDKQFQAEGYDVTKFACLAELSATAVEV